MTSRQAHDHLARRRRRSREEGVALIVVLGMVALFAVLTMMCVMAATAAKINGNVANRRVEAKYTAESLTSFVEWMVICDRRRSANRRLGTFQPDDELLEGPAWSADGQLQTLAIGEQQLVEFRILDANRGWDVSGVNPGHRLRMLRQTGNPDPEEPDEVSDFDVFVDILDDYVDRDDLRRLEGMESDDWEALGYRDFPRNNTLQFAEEAYWLPFVEALVPELRQHDGFDSELPEDLLQVIPPTGSRFAGKPSFFSSSAPMIRSVTGLTQEETELALEARDQWYSSRIPIQEGLGDLYSPVASRMSLDESGVYILDVRTGYRDSEISRRLVTTIDLRQLPRGGLHPHFSIWRQVVY